MVLRCDAMRCDVLQGECKQGGCEGVGSVMNGVGANSQSGR